METKQLDIACPCCESRLSVDVRTGKIMRWSRPEELDETGKPVTQEGDWDAAANRAGGRLSSAAEKFEEGVVREETRERDLDDLFKKASDKLKRGDDDDD